MSGILINHTDTPTGVGIYQIKAEVFIYSGCCLYRVGLDTDANVFFCRKCGARTKVQPLGMKTTFLINNHPQATRGLAWWIWKWTDLEVGVHIAWSSTSS